MRNAIVNGNSPMSEVLGVLTGIWNQYKDGPNKEWTMVKTPFFLHMEAVLEAGRHELPIAPNDTKALYWTSKDDSGSLVIKAGTTGFDLPYNSFVEITIFGNTGGNNG